MAPQVGRTAEAAAGFRAAISVQPDGAEAYYNLGIAYKDQVGLGSGLGQG